MASLKFDKDGFLVGKGGKGALEVIIDNTEKILARVNQSKPARSSVPMTAAGAKVVRMPIPKVGKTITQTRKTPAQSSSQTVTQQISVKPTIVQTTTKSKVMPQRDEYGRFIKQSGSTGLNKVVAPDAKEAKVNTKERKKQTKLLDSLVKKSDKHGMGSMMLFSVLIPLLSMLGALIKLPITLPLAITKGAGKLLLPGLFGEKGGAGVAGKWGKRFLKGGLLGGAMALLGASDVEASNFSRSDKNKAHVKNGVSGLGGIGGAMVGAMLGASVGSVVPVIGTTIGGVLGAVIGGFSGSLITESVVDWLDGLIDSNLSNEMFGSWEGFTKNAGVLWGKFTKESQKQSRNLWLKFGGPIAPYWEFLKIVAADGWKLFSDAVSPYWEGASTATKAAWHTIAASAKPYWDDATTVTSKAWDAISAYAKATFDQLKGSWLGEKAGQTGSAVGKGVTTVAGVVADVYKKTKASITGYSDKTMEQAKTNASEDFPQYKTSGGNKKLNHALSFDGGNIKGMTEAETRAFAANVAQTESGFNKKVQNKHGYTGMYQFGAEALTDIGFINSENYIAARQEAKKAGVPWDYTSEKGAAAQIAFMNNPKNWNIEGGIEAYKNSASLQNKSFAMLANKNIKYGAKANSTLTSGAQVAKFLKMAHLKGAGNAANGMLNPEFDKKDGNGTSMQAYGNGAARDLNKFTAEVSAAMSKTVKSSPLNVDKKTNADSVLPLSTKNVNFTSSSVATPKIVLPSSIKLSSPVVPIVAPNSIKANDQPTGYRSNNLSHTSTSLPHKPLNRRVDHEYIAWMASGGTGMG